MPAPWPRRLLRLLWLSLAGSVIAAALLLTLARLLLPLADRFRPDIAEWAGQALRQPVAIGRLDADWQGLEPGLILEDTTLLDAQGRPLLHLRRARIGLDLWASLRRGALVSGSIRLEGLRLAAVREADGRLRVRGLGPGADPGKGRDFARWLLEHKRLTVEDSDIELRDLTTEPPRHWRFRHVTIDLRNLGGRHLIDLAIELPFQMGYALTLTMDLRGDILRAHGWGGRAYLSVRGLRLDHLPADLRHGPVSVEDGRLNLQLWSWWENGRVRRVNGAVDARDLRLLRRRDDALLSLQQLGGVIDWQSEADGRWWLAAHRLRLQSGARSLPPTRLWARHSPATETRPAHLEARVERFALEDVLALARFFDELPTHFTPSVDRLRPQAEIRDLHLILAHGAPPRFHLRARLHDLRNRAWQWIPGFDGVEAELQASEAGGNVTLQGQDLRLSLARIYDHPMDLSRLAGQLHWRRAPRAWVLDLTDLHAENPTLALAGRVRLRLPTDGRSPQLIMGLHLRSPAPEHLRDILPTALLPPGLRDWLTTSLHAGAIERGEILYLGRTHRFPFRNGEGRFLADLDLREARLTPAPGWPTIDAIEGRLRIDHRRLRLSGAEGRIYQSHLHDVVAEIPDLYAREHHIEVRGAIASNARDVLRYLHESPLEEIFAKELRPFEGTGPVRLGLSLEIPLQAGEVKIQGRATLEGVRFASDFYQVDLSELRGPLRFTETGLWSRGLEGRLDGLPVTLTLDTDGEPRRLHIGGRGHVHREALRGILARYTDYPHWADYSAGQTPWEGRLTLPLEATDPAGARLEVRSDLHGLAITLPEPLAKPADGIRPFTLGTDLGSEHRRLEIDYGDLHARLRLVARGESWNLERGAVSVGRIPELPPQTGLWFSGHVPHFSWTAWSSVLFPEDDRPPLFPDTGGVTPSQYYDVTLGELEVFDFRFEDIALQASDSAQGWTIHTRSPRLAGSIFVPLEVTTAPLMMDMVRLHLVSPPPDEVTPSRTRPTELPAFVVDAEDFRFDRLRFGRLALRASRIPKGLRLDRLSMRTEVTDIQASGQWLEGERGKPRPPQTSRFRIEADSRDLGRTLREWDYAGTIEGGRGRILIDAHWPGNPAQFDLARLNGRLELDLKDGRLLEVDPGAARIFGLISLQTLPRRLSLDFSDLFDKGFAFDRITGRYRIEDGVASTDGLIMEGPAARIIARGRIDLGRRRYDQEVAIIPRLGESLPLIGTALTGAPPVGATLLLLQRLLEKPLSELSTIRYRVTGPWNDPQVERIQTAPEPSEEILQE